MFFELSKIAGFLSRPSNLLIGLVVVAIGLLATRYARCGRRLLVVSVALILVVGYLPVGAALLLPLEERFPSWDPARGAPDGIIVLGGEIDADRSQARETPIFVRSGERISMGAELAARFPQARVVFTGGTNNVVLEGAPEARYAVPLLERLGVARGRIEVEDRSRNTAENAAFTAALIDPKPGQRWLLVTSAFHMPRAVGCFRRAGIPVEAVPVDRRIDRSQDFYPSPSLGEGLAMADMAAREWVGLMVYWLTGRTSSLLPGP